MNDPITDKFGKAAIYFRAIVESWDEVRRFDWYSDLIGPNGVFLIGPNGVFRPVFNENGVLEDRWEAQFVIQIFGLEGGFRGGLRFETREDNPMGVVEDFAASLREAIGRAIKEAATVHVDGVVGDQPTTPPSAEGVHS